MAEADALDALRGGKQRFLEDISDLALLSFPFPQGLFALLDLPEQQCIRSGQGGLHDCLIDEVEGDEFEEVAQHVGGAEGRTVDSEEQFRHDGSSDGETQKCRHLSLECAALPPQKCQGRRQQDAHRVFAHDLEGGQSDSIHICGGEVTGEHKAQ